MLVSCKDDESSVIEFSDLSQESKNLSISTNAVNSIFEPFQVFLSKPVGKGIEDKTTGEIVKIEIDSVTLKSNIEGSYRIDGGSFVMDENSDTSFAYNPGKILLLNETYVLRVYFNYFVKKESNWEQLNDFGSKYNRSLWLEYTPGILDGKDVVFGTTKNGMSADINVYDGDMLIDIKAPAMFDIEKAPANSNIALLYKSISVKGNKSTDLTQWKLETDSTNIGFRYVPELVEGTNHLFPGLYYTVNMQFYYMAKQGDSWTYVFDAEGDTILWDKNYTFGTTDLFVPSQMITKLLGVTIPEDIRNLQFKVDVNIDTIPEVQFKVPFDKEITFDGVEFKPVLDTFLITKNKLRQEANIEWINKGDRTWASADFMGLRIEPDSLYFVPQGKYVVNAISHWEFKHNDEWLTIIQEDTLFRENVSVQFTTDIPDMPEIITAFNLGDEMVNVGMDAKVGFTLGYKENAIISYKGFSLRNHIKTVKISHDINDVISEVISDSVVLADDLVSALFVLDTFLIPNELYSVEATAYWEFLDKDGIWKNYTSDGVNVDEEKMITFTTMDVPNAIVESISPRGSNVALGADLMVQLNYDRGVEVNHNGIRFKPSIDKISLFDGNSTVSEDITVAWESESMIKVSHQEWFVPGNTYFVQVLAHWEYVDVDNGSFKPIYEADSFRVEGIAKKGLRAKNFPGEIFRSMTPVDTGIAVDSIAILNLNYGHNIAFADEDAETDFRAVLDSFVMYAYNGSDSMEVDASLNWLDDKTVTLTPNVLEKGTRYGLFTSAHWDWKNQDGDWIQEIPTDAELKTIVKNLEFTTETK